MSEEIENATVVVPRAMITSIVLNGSLGFGFLIALLFSMGDIYVALGTPTGYPIIEIFRFATNSNLAATLMITGIVLSAITSTWGLLSAASRMTWAFCRDNGLPYSTYFAHVRTSLSLSTPKLTPFRSTARATSPSVPSSLPPPHCSS
jgi:choline transport protein